MTDVDMDQLVADAHRHTQPVGDLIELLRDHLQPLIQPIPTHPNADPHAGVTFVDGGVASDQSDALGWAAAVAVGQQAGQPDRVARRAAVLPVTPDMERLRSILMGACEVETAAEAAATGGVFVDGGLVTGLLSISYHTSLHDPEARAVSRRVFTDDMLGRVEGYCRAILAGRVVGLPKQDTATTYSQLWADQLTDQLPAHWVERLPRMRDRPLIGAILKPGEMLAGRPAVEARRLEAQPGTDEQVATQLDAMFAHIRGCDHVQVAYLRPTQGAQRVLKIEHAGGLSAQPRVAARVAAMCSSSHMQEPDGQYLVDVAAKREVRMLLGDVTAVLGRELGPNLTRHYRT